MDKTSGMLKKIIIGIIVIGVLVALITPTIMKNISITKTYEYAQTLIENDSYEGALSELKKIEDNNYKDTEALISLCEAHIDFGAGNVSGAYFKLEDETFRYQTPEQQKKIAEFKTLLDVEYDKYIEEQAKKREEEYRTKVRTGVPFVGMSESDIAKTSLGSPSPKTRGNTEMINGKSHHATLYDFMSGQYVVFTARCIQGKVTEVWDYRDEPHLPYGSSAKKSSSSSKKTYHDSYDDGYEDVYNDGDYDWDRYDEDDDYARGVDDALDDWDEYGEDW